VRIEVQVCVVGGGPAASILCYLLAKRGVDVYAVGKNDQGVLSTNLIDRIGFNVIPIFPVIGSNLYHSLRLSRFNGASERLRVEYVESDAIVKPSRAFLPTSFAALAFEKFDRRGFVLSEKLFGELIFTFRLRELELKILRHYLNSPGFGERVGFWKGKSPYHYMLEGATLRDCDADQIKKLDARSKILVTANNEIHYDKLVLTLPAHKVLRLLGIEDSFKFLSSDADFRVFHAISEQPANLLKYDCRLDRPIYRAFVPTPNHFVLQIGKHSQRSPMSDIVENLRDLFPDIVSHTFLGSVILRGAYPLGVGETKEWHLVRSQLAKRKIFLFGRMSTWEYRDLHELNWEIIDDLV
jgi:hypothetical protein